MSTGAVSNPRSSDASSDPIQLHVELLGGEGTLRTTLGREVRRLVSEGGRLDGLTFLSGLRTLKLGSAFDQSLKGVTLPNSLNNLEFGEEFDQSLECVTFPNRLQTLTFGHWFNQSLEGVSLPHGLQMLTSGRDFNQSLEQVTLPSTLVKLELEGIILSKWRKIDRKNENLRAGTVARILWPPVDSVDQ
eukprot:s81_g22.t1